MVSDRTQDLTPGAAPFISKTCYWDWLSGSAADWDVCRSNTDWKSFHLQPGQTSILSDFNKVSFSADFSESGSHKNKHVFTSDGWHWNVTSTIRVSLPKRVAALFEAPMFMNGTISINLQISSDWTKAIRSVRFDLSKILSDSYFGSRDMSNRMWSVVYTGITKAAWNKLVDLYAEFQVDWYYGDNAPWTDLPNQYVSLSVDWSFAANRSMLVAPQNPPREDDSDWETDGEESVSQGRFG